MAIFQTPSTYTFAGNFPDIIIATNNPVDQNDAAILAEHYTAQGSRVTIKLKSFFESELSADPLTAEDISSRPFQQFHYTINGEASATFYVLPGGVGGHVDAATFITSNFLTWQPQTRRTTFHAPQWLRYASLQNCTLRVKAYFTDDMDETKDLATMSAGSIYTFDVSYGKIRGKFIKQIKYYDIWVAGTDRLTFVQRYVLAESYEICDDYFVFENTLGGFDTAKFSGESKEISEAESRTSIVNWKKWIN